MKYKAETILPYDGKEKKGEQIQKMFDSIARNYDLLNHTLSLGIDFSWRKKTVQKLGKYNPKVILDVASGTGDLAIMIAKMLNVEKIVGADLSENMLQIGREKAIENGLSDIISFEQQDCTALTYDDQAFDAVTVSFGVRNFENLEKGYEEMYRVLRPKGVLMVLELSTPAYFPMKQLYKIYSAVVIPNVTRLISREKVAYTYLTRSVEAVPQANEMLDLFKKAGFKNCSYKTFTLGICSLYIGQKE